MSGAINQMCPPYRWVASKYMTYLKGQRTFILSVSHCNFYKASNSHGLESLEPNYTAVKKKKTRTNEGSSELLKVFKNLFHLFFIIYISLLKVHPESPEGLLGPKLTGVEIKNKRGRDNSCVSKSSERTALKTNRLNERHTVTDHTLEVQMCSSYVGLHILVTKQTSL